MKVRKLKDIISNLDDNLDIFIRNSVNICGGVSELEQVEKATYGFFGDSIPCLILNTCHVDIDLERDKEGKALDFVERGR